MKVLMFGEMRVSEKGVVHQADFAEALGAERTTTVPKEDPVQIIVGKLLGGRKPALLARIEKDFPINTVEEVLTPEVGAKIVELLGSKPKLEGYERRALDHLKGRKLDTDVLADVFPAPKKRRSKKKSAA